MKSSQEVQYVSSVPTSLVEALAKPRPKAFVEEKVSFSMTEVLKAYIDALYSSMVAKTSFLGSRELSFDVQELGLYLLTLLSARIDYTNRKHVDPVLHPKSHVSVPAFFSDILSNVGVAETKELGITLIPEMDWEGYTPMDVKRVKEISQMLRVLGDCGFVCSEGYSADRYGSFAFMAMQRFDDEMLRHSNDAHPVYALLSSVIRKAQVLEVLSPRVIYASVPELRYAVERLAEARHG